MNNECREPRVSQDATQNEGTVSFRRVPDREQLFSVTCRTGTIKASFDVMTNILGEHGDPGYGDGKVQCRWKLVDEYGCRLEIWAYKYGEGHDLPVTACTEWSMYGCKRLAMALFGPEHVK